MILYTGHAVLRARQRHGIEPSAAEWTQAVLDVIDAVDGTAHRALLLRRAPGGTEHWLVRLAGVALVVVYAPDAAAIVTVLP